MSIDEGFDLSLFSKELGTEIIGQSVCLSLHKHIAISIKNHLMEFVNKGTSNIKGYIQKNENSSPPLIQQSLFA